MDIKKLEADLVAVFDDYPYVQTYLRNPTDSSFTITVKNTRNVSSQVLSTFIRLLDKYGFKTYEMEVRNKFTKKSKRYFSSIDIDEAIAYKPHLWEQTIWKAYYYSIN